MRVGVGVGAVMLGGCDMVTEAKARVFGEDEVEAAVEVEAEVEPAAAPSAPEPMLLSRGGVAGVVDDVARSQSSREPAAPPVRDLGRRFGESEPEGSRAFVPYDGEAGALAIAPAPVRTAAPSKPRNKRKVARPDEPCDPALASVGTTRPGPEWQCPACGRG